jgi:hypothetical protein
MNTWYTMPVVLPVDNQECWVRLNDWFGLPFKAVWHTAGNEWTDKVNGIIYPVWTISRWRPV